MAFDLGCLQLANASRSESNSVGGRRLSIAAENRSRLLTIAPWRTRRDVPDSG